ncbi:MAG: hypothetical protein M0Z61_07640 [Nitrospiraceae bacterium]|nr:hypothetical protein [Nitrospiraceae bacterium]
MTLKGGDINVANINFNRRDTQELVDALDAYGASAQDLTSGIYENNDALLNLGNASSLFGDAAESAVQNISDFAGMLQNAFQDPVTGSDSSGSEMKDDLIETGMGGHLKKRAGSGKSRGTSGKGAGSSGIAESYAQAQAGLAEAMNPDLSAEFGPSFADALQIQYEAQVNAYNDLMGIDLVKAPGSSNTSGNTGSNDVTVSISGPITIQGAGDLSNVTDLAGAIETAIALNIQRNASPITTALKEVGIGI